MTFGYSRDDVGKFLPIYLAQGILQNDPFEVSPILTQVHGLLGKIDYTKRNRSFHIQGNGEKLKLNS
jgi:hypothetical protein